MKDEVFVDIGNIGHIKKANVRFDGLTLLTGTDNNAILTFVEVLEKLCNNGEYKEIHPKSNAYADISCNKKNDSCYHFDFLRMTYRLIYDITYNCEVNIKNYLVTITNEGCKKYDTAILYMPEASCLSAYDSVLLVRKTIKYLCEEKNVDTIVVTQSPHIMELVAYYGEYLFHTYDINFNCCISENGVIQCGSSKGEGDSSDMMEKAFKMYNSSFKLLNKMRDKAEKAKDNFANFAKQLNADKK